MPLSDLQSIRKQFEYYKSLGEKTLAQISDDDLFFEYNEDSNSIAVTVNHLWGNMLSRWTDFLTSDGEKEWRNRDQEFESIIKTREELLQKWNEGWECVFTALDSVNEDNFGTRVYIRNQSHSIMDAALRQLAHYAYHVGQIVYVGRMLAQDWNSLTVPKGKSKEFNQAKFAKGKHDGHFTDDFK
ncbi:DUF1572 family protein [Roseivirga sp. E12]|uniref:DUF1572 family protein n=1 Tax=Roseivirga sp. E12 TaxID=2819237 RepID=UPI001ABC978E|nr:DUF1572 family protein [Roseivirga sp. E12]MBO3696899.1 DUF1572 family protein [Roseivirga sp. E12]